MSLPNNRRLQDYLPLFLSNFFEPLLSAEEPELISLWDQADQVLDNAFVFSADEDGLGRIENMLRITPKASDTLDDRRFALQAILTQQQVITMHTLREQLTALCGAGGYVLALDADNYQLTVKLELGVKSQFDVVKNLMTNTVPANLILTVTLLYNTHRDLSDYTHAQLAAKTHKQLREEIL